MASIFEEKEIFVKEKVRFFKFGNVFDFYNLENVKIGEGREENLFFLKKILKLTGIKPFLPFTISLYDSSNTKLVTFDRPLTFWMSQITILDAGGNQIGKYQQKFRLLKPTFVIFDNNNVEFAKIEGNFVAWNFVITLNDGTKVGEINKKFSGIAKEMFTTADNYIVKLNSQSLSKEHKKILISVACIIDMVFKEYNG